MDLQNSDEETAEELDKFFDMADWEEWYNSAWDGEESWFEIGERTVLKEKTLSEMRGFFYFNHRYKVHTLYNHLSHLIFLLHSKRVDLCLNRAIGYPNVFRNHLHLMNILYHL